VVISAVSTLIAAVATPAEDPFRVDLDYPADTCCVGNGVLIVNQSERRVRVTLFIKSLGSVSKVPIVTAAIAYDNPKTGEVTILLVHQALHFPEMNNCLLSPMQQQLNYIEVNKRPKFLTVSPTSNDHAIIAVELLIPLVLHGITSFFHGQKPAMKEYKECACTELTYPHSHWSPHEETYADKVALQNELDDEPRFLQMIKAVHDDRSFERDLVHSLQVASMASVQSDPSQFKLTPEQLSQTWGSGLTIAKKTLETTMQKAVRTVLHPNVEQRWLTGDRPLQYKWLHHQVFHDNMKSQVVSLRGNKCCEIYATEFGWSRAFPYRKNLMYMKYWIYFLADMEYLKHLSLTMPKRVSMVTSRRKLKKL
jgi:hypothetical protein